MALQMSYKDQYGNELAESYWRLVQCNISVPDKTALIVFYGYVSKTARDDMKSPVTAKQYAITGEYFDSWYSNILEAENTNLAKSAYDYAKSCKDVKADDKVISFFETSVSV